MLVGVSMAITIAICIVAFIWIYARVGPFLSDFIPAETATQTPLTRAAAGSPVAGSGAGTAATPQPSASPGSQAQASRPTPGLTPTPIWEATHRIADGPQINFRAGPSTAADVLAVLPPRTPLKFLGEQRQAGGATWMRFQNQQGAEGWIRSIDVVPISP
jgi:hypothetical protein